MVIAVLRDPSAFVFMTENMHSYETAEAEEGGTALLRNFGNNLAMDTT